ncbi:hypothetical protein ABK040_012292 [Willaertia magna]
MFNSALFNFQGFDHGLGQNPFSNIQQMIRIMQENSQALKREVEKRIIQPSSSVTNNNKTTKDENEDELIMQEEEENSNKRNRNRFDNYEDNNTHSYEDTSFKQTNYKKRKYTNEEITYQLTRQQFNFTLGSTYGEIKESLTNIKNNKIGKLFSNNPNDKSIYVQSNNNNNRYDNRLHVECSYLCKRERSSRSFNKKIENATKKKTVDETKRDYLYQKILSKLDLEQEEQELLENRLVDPNNAFLAGFRTWRGKKIFEFDTESLESTEDINFLDETTLHHYLQEFKKKYPYVIKAIICPDAGMVFNEIITANYIELSIVLEYYFPEVYFIWWGQYDKYNDCDVDELPEEELFNWSYLTREEYVCKHDKELIQRSKFLRFYRDELKKKKMYSTVLQKCYQPSSRYCSDDDY